jgi:hydroxyquinol 1,2-dioxygenase
MRNVDETTITAAVIEKVGRGCDRRIRLISEALVRNLHAFVHEIEPTQAEWDSAIDFLTRTVQACTATPQEFILLSDALGVSMLVDAINHRLPGAATETTVLGPFYVQAASEYALGDDIAEGMAGKKLLVEGTVSRVDGTLIAGAVVNSWHADGDGFYDVQRPTGLSGLSGRARFRTDADGRFWFRSIVPAAYPIPDDGPVGDMLKAQGRHPYRPAHVHFLIGHPGYETLVTHVFLDRDRFLDSDVVFGVKDSLIRSLDWQEAGTTPRGNHIDEPMAALRFDFVVAESRAVYVPPVF